jgi:hypothetical protein
MKYGGEEAYSKVFSGMRKQMLHTLRPRNLGKFDAKSDEGIFLGYSSTSCACKVFNKRTATIM